MLKVAVNVRLKGLRIKKFLFTNIYKSIRTTQKTFIYNTTNTLFTLQKEIYRLTLWMLQKSLKETVSTNGQLPMEMKVVETGLNVMAHAQKPDFVFWRKVRVHLNRRRESVQSTAGSRGVRNSDSNAGYTMFQGSVKGTGYPLHSPLSPSIPLPCVTVCHHISSGV